MKPLDPTTQDRQDALQQMINAQLFAPSTSALAKRLGYKGKTSLYRIQQGEASAGAIDEAWDKLLAFVGVDEDVLYATARAAAYTTNLKRLVQHEGKEEVEREHHHKWVLLSIMKKEEHHFSESFQRDVWPDLMELRDNDDTAFWMMMALYYFDAEGADAYGKDFDLLTTLNGMHSLLRLNYESSELPQRGVNNIFREDYIDLYSKQCTWDLMYYGYIALMCYGDLEAQKRTLEQYALFNLGDNSFWLVPGTVYERGAHVWHLLEMQIAESRHGMYYAIELEMGRNKEEFHLVQIVPMLFNEEPGTVQMEVTQQRIPLIRGFEWADSFHTLHLMVSREEEQRYGIPRHLQRIDLDSPQGKEEKIWANVLKPYDQQIPPEIEAELYHFEGVDALDDDYTIENVTIDRHTLTIRLTDKAEGITSDYSIGIRRHVFLRTLLPSDIISIVRPLQTGELCFRWALRGYMIPFGEFEKG